MQQSLPISLHKNVIPIPSAVSGSNTMLTMAGNGPSVVQARPPPVQVILQLSQNICETFGVRDDAVSIARMHSYLRIASLYLTFCPIATVMAYRLVSLKESEEERGSSNNPNVTDNFALQQALPHSHNFTVELCPLVPCVPSDAGQ